MRNRAEGEVGEANVATDRWVTVSRSSRSSPSSLISRSSHSSRSRSLVGSFLTFLTFLTVTTFLTACSRAEKAKAVDWRQVPVSIELRLAQSAPAAGLVPTPLYGRADSVYVHRDLALSNTQIARVEATKARIGQGLILDVWLTRDGARRMADLSRHHMGSKLAVLIDSVVVSVPTIQDTLDLGTGMPFDVGVPLGPEETEQLARAVSQTWPARPARR